VARAACAFTSATTNIAASWVLEQGAHAAMLLEHIYQFAFCAMCFVVSFHIGFSLLEVVVRGGSLGRM